MPHLLPFALLFTPLLAALPCLLRRSALVAEWSSGVGAMIMLALGIWLVAATGAQPTRFEPGLYVDALTAVLVLVITVVGAAVVLASLGYMRREVEHEHLPASHLHWYYLWLQLFLFMMLLTALAANLGILWTGIECTTVLSGVLVGFYRKRESLEAAWKYVVICSLGIALALFGTVLIYYSAVSVVGQGNGALDWATLAGVAPRLDPHLLRLSFGVMLVGFGTKAGLAPMHTWLPDAHSQAPTPISAALSAVLLNCAIYAILRYHAIVSRALGPDFSSHLLLAFGLFSIAVAIPFLIVQHDVKRLLAYSSVEHMGIITVAAGIGGRLGLFAALLHLVNHAFTKSAMFLNIGAIIQRLGTRNIHRLGGAARQLPGAAAVALLGGLALAGSPPFGPFLGEFTTVRAAFQSGQDVTGAVLLLLLAAAFGGIMLHLGRIALGPEGQSTRSAPRQPVNLRDLLGILAIGALSLVVVLLGVHVPGALVTLLQRAAAVIGGW